MPSRSRCLESDGASSAASIARSAMSISSGGTLPAGAPSASISPASKRASSAGAERQQRRLPLPLVGDAVEAAVVQLVTEVERELEVLVGQRIGGDRRLGRAQPVRVAHERVEERMRQRAARDRECRHAPALPGAGGDGTAPKHVGVRAAVHVAAALALAALAFAVGRWLRDPSPGGSFLILLGAAILWVVGGAPALPPGRSGAGAAAGAGDAARSRPTTASTSTRPTPPSSSGSRASAPSARAGSSRSATPPGLTGRSATSSAWRGSGRLGSAGSAPRVKV